MQEIDLSDLTILDIHAESAEPVTWNGRRALKLQNGLALLRDRHLAEGSIELDLGVESGPAYPGLAFHAADASNYETIYCQPHTSGLWDALQYDPVFQGTNTWQIFNGPRFQAAATVPHGRWLTLRVEVRTGHAVARIMGDDTAPLVVPALAHGPTAGRLGIWTYLPAFFGGMRIGPAPLGTPPAWGPAPAPGTVTEWWLEGHGRVTAEPNGTLNLNRYLRQAPDSVATLTHSFQTETGELTLAFGFSDEICIYIDGAEIFSGTNRFTGFADRSARGYVEPGAHRVPVRISPGCHELRVRLGAREPFGWGLVMHMTGD